MVLKGNGEWLGKKGKKGKFLFGWKGNMKLNGEEEKLVLGDVDWKDEGFYDGDGEGDWEEEVKFVFFGLGGGFSFDIGSGKKVLRVNLLRCGI